MNYSLIIGLFMLHIGWTVCLPVDKGHNYVFQLNSHARTKETGSHSQLIRVN